VSPRPVPGDAPLAIAGGLSHARVVWQSTEEIAATYLAMQRGEGHIAEAVALRLIGPQAELGDILRQDSSAAVRADQGVLLGGLVAPSVRVLELVAGAQIVVQAAPAEPISLVLTLATPQGTMSYAQQRIADGDGRATFVVPYEAPGRASVAGDRDGGPVFATGPYRVVRGGAVSGEVAVSDEVVRGGGLVVVGAR
jgi:hypothetical protein